MHARTLTDPHVLQRAACLALTVSALACTAGRSASPGAAPDTSRMGVLSRSAGLREVTFTPAPGEGARLVAWRATGGFHDVAAFVDGLREALPTGCSTRLELRTSPSSEASRLAIAGTLAPERGEAGAHPCAALPTLVAALDGISATIPPTVWTTDIAQDGMRLEVRGSSLGGEDALRQFVRALDAAGPFAAVRLLSTAPVEGTGRPRVAFSLELTLRP
jgi:hypothetical protein